MRKLIAWVKYVATSNIYPKRWQDRLFRGHVSLGPLVIFGANAMHWAINLRVCGTWWCFHPSTKTYGGDWPWHFYISRDATPHKATFKMGKRFKRNHCYDTS